MPTEITHADRLAYVFSVLRDARTEDLTARIKAAVVIGELLRSHADGTYEREIATAGSRLGHPESQLHNWLHFNPDPQIAGSEPLPLNYYRSAALAVALIRVLEPLHHTRGSNALYLQLVAPGWAVAKWLSGRFAAHPPLTVEFESPSIGNSSWYHLLCRAAGYRDPYPV